MNKKNIILALVLGFLLVFAYLYQGPFKTLKYSQNKSKNIFEKINLEEITAIEIIKGPNSTKLSREDLVEGDKKNTKWKIGGTRNFYANENFSNEIIDKMKELKESDLEIISENKDNKGDFSTDSSGVEIKLLKDENVLASFIVGDLSGFSKTYISKNDIDETFLVDLNINNVFVKDNWYDLTILNIDETKVSKLRFQYPDREFTIEKIDNEWKGVLPHEFNIDEDIIKTVLNIASKLKAVSIPSQAFEGTGLEKHSIIVQVIGEGIDQTIMVGDKNESGHYYVKKGSSDNIYLIKESDKEEFDKKINDFK